MNRLLAYRWFDMVRLGVWVMTYVLFTRFISAMFSGVGVVSAVWFFGWLILVALLINGKKHRPVTFPLSRLPI